MNLNTLFSNLLDDPNEDTLCSYLAGANCSKPRLVAQQSLKQNKRMANRALAEKNHFLNYSAAVNYVYDCCRAAGYQIPETLWPSLHTEKNERVKISLDNKCDLVVCLYKFQSGTVECVAYIS